MMKSFSCLLFALLFLAALPATAEDRKPNIVFILLDNIGQERFGCYGGEAGVTLTHGAMLAALPPDNPPPFPLRSQSGFKLPTAKREAARAKTQPVP